MLVDYWEEYHRLEVEEKLASEFVNVFYLHGNGASKFAGFMSMVNGDLFMI